MHAGIRDLLERAQASMTGLNVSEVISLSYDPWRGIAADLIERFLEIQRLAGRLDRESADACRADLQRVDEWMMRERDRTLVTAHPPDLRRYVDAYIEGSTSMRTVFRALWHMRGFYRFLLESGCRGDDPLEQILTAPREPARSGCPRAPDSRAPADEAPRCSIRRSRREMD